MEVVTEDKSYLSPKYKLLAFFENSRDRWKAKALDREQEIRRLEKRIVGLEASRQKWKKKAKAQRVRPAAPDEQQQKRA